MDNSCLLQLGSKTSGGIVRTLSTVLTAIASLSHRKNNNNNDLFQRFESSYAPDVSLYDYISRIFTHSNCSEACLVFCIVYLDRLAQKKRLVVSALNIHRLVIVLIMIAAKFHDDLFYNNSFYAKLGGLSLSELNKLEVETLKLLHFSLVVSPDEMRRYVNMMQSYCGPPTLIPTVFTQQQSTPPPLSLRVVPSPTWCTTGVGSPCGVDQLSPRHAEMDNNNDDRNRKSWNPWSTPMF